MISTTLTPQKMINNWPNYAVEDILAASERVNWQVEDVIGGDKRLDFSKPFMPDSLGRTEQLEFLTPHERLVLNQIRGHDYLYIFGVVEEGSSSCRSYWTTFAPYRRRTTRAFEVS